MKERMRMTFLPVGPATKPGRRRIARDPRHVDLFSGWDHEAIASAPRRGRPAAPCYLPAARPSSGLLRSQRRSSALCGTFFLLSAAPAYRACHLGRPHKRKTDMPIGKVKFFNTQKGFGFIQPEDGGNDAFVHISAVERAGMNSLVQDQRVSYELETDQRGKTSAVKLENA
jgi:cold shock protein